MGTSASRRRIIAGAVDDLRRVFQVVHGHSKRIERATGLTGPQLWAIKVLAESGALRVSDLARRMYLHPSTVVGILDRLAARGLVERRRSDLDRRVVAVSLSGRGRALVENVPEVAQGLLVAGLERLSSRDLETVSGGLRIVVGLLGAERMPPKLLLSPGVNAPGDAGRDGGRDLALARPPRPAGPWRRVWVFDFDGTLSPIVPDRDAARLHPACGAMLRRLVRRTGEAVAVLSSRALEDLVPRVPVEGVVLGGGSGLEWRLPGGERIGPGRAARARLAAARGRAERFLAPLRGLPGVEVEDKGWSAAVHFRRASREVRARLEPALDALRRAPGLRAWDGPQVLEVQFLPGVSKVFGVRRLCRILRADPSRSVVVYAGDDAGDAEAMRWVLDRGGGAIAVGGAIRLERARAAAGPAELARIVGEMAGAESARPGGGAAGSAAG